MEYLYFTFDNISSRKYNLIIQNQGQDLSFPSQPNFENQIISPLYQGTSYLAGINKKERIFNFKCWANSLSLENSRSMLKWLSVDKIGYLILDYNPNFKYKVKINSISDLIHIPVNDDGTINYEFTLSFVTIGDFNSLSVDEYNINNTDLSFDKIGLNFDNGGPIAFKDNNIVKFLNYYSEPIPFILSFTNSTAFDVSLNNVKYYDYEANVVKDFILDTTQGFCKIGNNLAETTNGVTKNTNLGVMQIPSGESSTLISDIDSWDSLTLVINDSDQLINYTSTDIASDNLYIIIEDGSYGNSSTQSYDPLDIENYIYNKINKDGTNSNINMLTFNKETTAIINNPAQIKWNSIDGTFDMSLYNDVILQAGQELHFYGKASSNITNGQVIMFNGIQGDHILLAPADPAIIAIHPEYVIGLATQNILQGNFGYVTWFGYINNISTTGFVAGDILFLSYTGLGQLTKAVPTAPNPKIRIAAVVKASTGSAENGRILVRPDFGYRFVDLNDVHISNLQNNQFLRYNSSNNRWENQDIIVDISEKQNISEKGQANGYASLDNNGKVPSTQLPSYVDDVLEYANLASFPVTGETGKIYIALDTNKTYRWSGSAYFYITSGAVDSVAGKTGIVTLVKGDVGLGSVDNTADSTKNVLSATKLTTARTINGVSFDGSANITIADSTKQPLDADLTAIAELAGTSGLLKKTAANTWTLDTNAYVTSSGVTSVTGTAPIVSSGGTTPAISISAATTSTAGSMSAADKTKLDGIAASANNYSLPTATSTIKGGIEIFSDTVQSVAANTVTTIASRTYGIQLNSNGQAVVNVPWEGSSATYIAGNGLGLSGTTFSLDTPGTITSSTTNNVTADSHTHALSISAADIGAASTSHSHGNITNLGAIGTTSDQVVITGTSGVLTTVSRSGIDSRSTFPPSTHNHDDIYYTENEVDTLLDTKSTLLTTTETITVGTGGQFATINAALAYATKKYPTYVSASTRPRITISLLSGFVMAEQVLVDGIDLSWITISSVDAEVSITRSALTIANADGRYPAFTAQNGAFLPIINVLFNMDTSGSASNRYGIMASNNSKAIINSGKGVKNAGSNGIVANQSSTVNANGTIVSGAGSNGIIALKSSTIDANGANASGAGTYGIYAENASTINANSANVSYANYGGVYATNASTIEFSNGNAQRAGYNISDVLVNANADGIYANASSTINADSANASYSARYGVYARRNSRINFRSGIATNTGSFSVNAQGNSTVYAGSSNCSTDGSPAEEYIISQNSFIDITEATGEVNTSPALNSYTPAGLIINNTGVITTNGSLPLTGGTLTGALNGTTITTSGAIKGNQISIVNNQINRYDYDGTAPISINYTGYNGGTTQFRSFTIYDGKQNIVADFTGSNKSTNLYGPLNGTSATFTGTATAPTINATSSLQINGTSVQTSLDGKQATLVSGTNIKTINGSSVLGSGDLVVGGGQMLGNSTVKAISYNAQTIGENIIIPAAYNAMSVGDITILDGYTVSLEDGAVWAII